MWKACVLAMENENKLVKMLKDENGLHQWIYGFLGMVSFVVSLMWIIHIVV